MKILVSGLVNVETTLQIKEFPIQYSPIEYPFFGINSAVSGVAYNVSKAMKKLGNDVELVSMIGNDFEGEQIVKKLEESKIGSQAITRELNKTPTSLVLFDEEGKRKIYCDLKDIQEKQIHENQVTELVEESDMIVACNINFNRSLLKLAKEKKKIIASDVHVLSDSLDEYNKEFMEYADILFLSDEQIPCKPEDFLTEIKNTYACKIVVIGQGSKGALLYDRLQDKIYKLPVVTVGKVVNTVGAGDALFASFLNYYGKGLDAISALTRAQIFASKKIGSNGASVGFIEEEEVEELYKKLNM